MRSIVFAFVWLLIFFFFLVDDLHTTGEMRWGKMKMMRTRWRPKRKQQTAGMRVRTETSQSLSAVEGWRQVAKL